MKNSTYIPQTNLSYSANYALKVDSIKTFLTGAKLSGKIKIDTGCGITSLGVADQFQKDTLKTLKKRDILLFREKKIIAYKTYGVHDADIKKGDVLSGKYNLSNCTDNEILADPRVSFQHKTNHFCINDVDFGPLEFGINYDRIGHSLLGVNFLQHIKLELIPLKSKSYLRLAKINKEGILNKVKELLREQMTLGNIVESLKEDGYEESEINSALTEVLKDTYATPGTID